MEPRPSGSGSPSLGRSLTVAVLLATLACSSTARGDSARVEAIVLEMPRVGTVRALADAYADVESESGEDAQRLWVFIGDIERRHGHMDKAAAAYARARALGDDTRWGKYARLGAGEVSLATADYKTAETLFGALAGDPDHAIASVAIQKHAGARSLKRQSYAGWAALGFIAMTVLLEASLLARGRRARPRLKVPTEILFAAPVLAALTLAAAVADRRLVGGFALLGAGWLGLAWLGLAAMQSMPASESPRKWAIGAIWLLSSACALYVFVWRTGLFFALVETAKHGVDH